MKLMIYSLFALILSTGTFAQSLKGNVYELDDKGEKIPLIGTNVFWEGSQVGTTTDENGFFDLKKIETDHLHLVVSYIGYEPAEIEIPSEQGTNICVLVQFPVFQQVSPLCFRHADYPGIFGCRSNRKIRLTLNNGNFPETVVPERKYSNLSNGWTADGYNIAKHVGSRA